MPCDVNSWPIGKRHWCWDRLRTRGEQSIRGWDGWMASPTRWTWVWASSRRWWRTGKPGMLQFMGSQRVGHNWLNKNFLISYPYCPPPVPSIIIIFKWEFSRIKYIRSIVQTSSHPVHMETFFILHNWNSVPIKRQCLISPPPRP